jgi:hydrogenase 3 maturation protease
MCELSWIDSLRQSARRLQPPDRHLRVAIVGVGHELRGDDAAGPVVARALTPMARAHDWLLVIEAGPAPENCTGALRRFCPDLVILIDTAQMELEPSSVRWLSWKDTCGISASTHGLPLHLVACYLHNELGCEVALIGIQPASTDFGATLSPVVIREIGEIVGEILDVFNLDLPVA